eukprot:COSAG02_NODE_70398_length_196_cov_25.835052_1_plen_58_part_10
MACLLMQQQCGFFYWDEIDCLLSQQQYEYRHRGGVSIEKRWTACLCSSSVGIFYWDEI